MKISKPTAIGGLLGGVGGALMGQQIHNASSGIPEAQTIGLDPGTEQLIQRKEAQANETPEQAADRLTKGLDAQQNQFAAATPFQNKLQTQVDPYSQALSSRLSRKMGDELALMKSKARQAAPAQALQSAQMAQQGAKARAGIAMQGYANKLNSIAAKKNARAQLFGSILGIGGTIAGAAIAGPGGAAAGNQAAQSLSPGQQDMMTTGQKVSSTKANLNINRMA